MEWLITKIPHREIIQIYFNLETPVTIPKKNKGKIEKKSNKRFDAIFSKINLKL